mgnify:CR=1 FL=1
MRYDAVIVGGSIGGLYTALALARQGRHVRVVERRPAIGVPVRCGEATGNRGELARFIPVEEEWIRGEIDGLAVHINESCVPRRELPDAALMLDRRRLELSLARQAREHGAEITLGTTATGLSGADLPHTVAGITTGSGETVGASWVIGADGAESSVGRWAGLTEALALRDSFSAAQFRVCAGDYHDGMLHFFVGAEIIPGGYIWVFPRGGSHLSVGAGLYGPSPDRPNALWYLERFLDRVFPGAKRDRLITGNVPLAVCPRFPARGNVFVVGDAARQANPLIAGGIMNTFEAADCLVRNLCGSATPAVAAKRYSRQWRAEQRRFQIGMFIAAEMVRRADDRELNRALRALDTVFAEPVDRSKPFRLSPRHVVLILRHFLPKLVGHWRHIPSLVLNR